MRCGCRPGFVPLVSTRVLGAAAYAATFGGGLVKMEGDRPDYENRYLESDEEEEEDGITSEDCWRVISAFFESKGLVSQQIDSFNDFMMHTMQEIVDANSTITVDHKSPPSNDETDPIVVRRYEIKFTRLILAKPAMTEGDGSTSYLLPQEARLRNLTYSAPMYIEMTKRVSVARERPASDLQDEYGAEIEDEGHIEKQNNGTYLKWEVEDEPPKDDEGNDIGSKVFIGKLPMMLKAKYCHLYNLKDEELYNFSECPYDQGGYFIINGSEKVLIAQERSAANIVQVFKKAQPTATPYVAEIRSALEKGSRLISSLQVKLFSSGGGKAQGATIKCTLPYIKSEIPIAIVFRALGVVSDEDILNHICFDRNDTQMMEMLKPCLEEAFVIQDQDIALDFIGKRGNGKFMTHDKRVKFARDVLTKELLPHVSQNPGNETKKAFFIGYMIHKMLQCALGRREVDDRDHFGKKRLDLAGPLLAGLFRTLFNKLTKDVEKYLKNCIENNREFILTLGVKSATLTNGLKYSLATGNWGEQKKAASSKAGVSQVLNRFTFASTLSHLRRTNTPIGRDGKIAKPRQLHNTHWGLVCPAETPEGQACGLVKNLALMCHVSVGTPSDGIVPFLLQRQMESLEEYDPHTFPNATKVFVNGVWVGVHRNAAHLVQAVQSLRRKHVLEPEVSLIRDIRDREFRILTDQGRVLRPLFVVDNDSKSNNCGNLVFNKEHSKKLDEDDSVPFDIDKENREKETFGWNGLIDEGVVEYVDAEEEETVMIVMTPQDLAMSRQLQAGYTLAQPDPDEPNRRVTAPMNPTAHTWTHCEIHPSMILGICASIIPFPDHNQVSSFVQRTHVLLTNPVTPQYLSVCHGQTSHGRLPHQLRPANGDDVSHSLLSPEASCDNAFHGISEIPRIAGRSKCYCGHRLLFWLQSRRLCHYEPKQHRSGPLSKSVL